MQIERHMNSGQSFVPPGDLVSLHKYIVNTIPTLNLNVKVMFGRFVSHRDKLRMTIAAAGGCLISGMSLRDTSLHSADAEKLDQMKYPRPPTVGKQPKINGLKIFSGNANTTLAENVAKLVGVELGKITVDRFVDGEVDVMVHENVRGKDVYIVQPTCVPVNEHLMELLLMVSTMRRSSARRITAIIPYYGYARQDRKMAARVPISAADVARLLEAMGVDRVIAVDLHCGQIQGFFGPRVPVDNLDGGLVGVSYFANHELVNPVIVSPDAGGVARAKKFREWLVGKYGVQNVGLAMIIKQRVRANEIDKMDLVGNVEGSDCIIVDDMIDTAGTLCKAAQHLNDHGARNVYAFASHGLFNGTASEKIQKSNLKEVVVVNTTPLPESCKDNEKITQLDIAPLIAQAIQNIHDKKSVSMLFD
uniref:ribose-phosphate diphosphokinase n=1 Tax=Albugo laibachii Nc14 TaxID=890382 RepID=F0WLG3_9STRA|nr:ribosephosphate pyrophosphokinase putative [Albugo laibachii Nc14]CCA23383.1 ribosephosphate pyrophosphokinase putative [Albugo laibachii Nc14]|eukprot:CCA23383.1 ribosephosphate pyrophosphokinase putative [Albugo laibachii Nc14]